MVSVRDAAQEYWQASLNPCDRETAVKTYRPRGPRVKMARSRRISVTLAIYVQNWKSNEYGIPTT